MGFQFDRLRNSGAVFSLPPELRRGGSGRMWLGFRAGSLRVALRISRFDFHISMGIAPGALHVAVTSLIHSASSEFCVVP